MNIKFEWREESFTLDNPAYLRHHFKVKVKVAHGGHPKVKTLALALDLGMTLETGTGRTDCQVSLTL